MNAYLLQLDVALKLLLYFIVFVLCHEIYKAMFYYQWCYECDPSCKPVRMDNVHKMSPQHQIQYHNI